MAKAKRPLVSWTQEQLDELIKLYLEGLTFEKISLKLGMSHASTKAKVTFLRQKGVDLPYRDKQSIAEKRSKTMKSGKKKSTAFDREYRGAVPLGHWLITKPWPYKPDKKEDVA
tara:strand:+ start:226 stop:567 length:342 start_codon:yes stop_codon:yes gene_type:complete